MRSVCLALLAGAAALSNPGAHVGIQNTLAAHGNWEDVSMICPAAKSSLGNCEFPAVSSTSLKGGLTTGLMTLNVKKFGESATPVDVISCTGPGTPGCTDSDIVKSEQFTFDEVGYYLFNYTASDDKGHQAEDIVFALFIDDLEEPVITLPAHLKHIESCNPKYDTTCVHEDFIDFDAVDAVYGDVSRTLRYSLNGGKSLMHGEAHDQFVAEQTKSHVALTVSASAHDFAGAYGKNGKNNVGHASTTFDISDTVAPKIYVSEGAVTSVECCKRDYSSYTRGDGYKFASCKHYVDAGATYNDAVDGNDIPVQTISSTVDISKKDTYSVKYTATDGNENSASVARKVTVIDTTPPYLALRGPAEITIHQYNKNAASDESDMVDDGSDLGTLEKWTAKSLNSAHLVNGIQVWDECTDVDAHEIHVEYIGLHDGDHGHRFEDAEDMAEQTGSYIVRYTVTDAAKLTAFIDRTVIVVDNTAPIIRLRGGDEKMGYLHFEEVTADATKDFTDPGATCKDFNNAELLVTTVSNNVDLTTLGTYDITYSCTDGTNVAYQQHRQVIVRDTKAPLFDMNLGGGVFITDTTKLHPVMDDISLPNGVIDQITIVQNNVEAGFPFKDPSGTATDFSEPTTITVSNNIVTESASKAWNMESCMAIHQFYEQASTGYYYITTSKSSSIGKVRVYCDMTTDKTTKACTGLCTCNGLGMLQLSTGVCTTSAIVTPNGYSLSHEAITQGSKMTQGSYVFQYFVKDAEGNTNDCWNHETNMAIPLCRFPMTHVRLIICTDTLPPVISLIQPNSDKVLFTNPQAVQAGGGNPFVQGALMAEQNSHINGWVVASAGFAAAGLALLGLSAKKTAVVAV
jgi:hypothetical protein